MCEACVENLRRYARLLSVTCVSTRPGPAPTAAGLERHARRFGPQMVAETAAEYGLDVDIERPRRPPRARRPSLQERVAALVKAGHSVEAIAEVEDLSPSRARRLVEGVGP